MNDEYEGTGPENPGEVEEVPVEGALAESEEFPGEGRDLSTEPEAVSVEPEAEAGEVPGETAPEEENPWEEEPPAAEPIPRMSAPREAFEAGFSPLQDLTFEAAEGEFADRGLDFNKEQKNLALKTGEGLWTNLGLLLSDQCTHTLKVACFNGTEEGNFKSRKEFGGSLLKQIHNAYDYISLSNNLKTRFAGLNRIESQDYPEEAIREILINAVVHRDYAYSGSTIVNIYSDRMEFVSLGGLIPGLSKNDLLMGVSQPRNERLAKIFYQLKLIEGYGTGIKKLMRAYRDSARQPTISVSEGVFVIELPNANFASSPQVPGKSEILDTRHRLVLEYLLTHGTMSLPDVQKLLSVKQTRAYNIIREMKTLGLITRDPEGMLVSTFDQDSLLESLMEAERAEETQEQEAQDKRQRMRL